MEQEGESPEHHRQRSEFIRKIVQSASFQPSVNERYRKPIPRTIVQFWHDLGRLPFDVEQCIRSWTVWKASGFKHRLFDERAAATFINNSLGARYKRVFERCYHPAMQADYFRLCYAVVEGGSTLMRTMYALVPQLTGSSTTEGSNFNLFATTPLRGPW
jgi:mannosyltransferase OCH1-like enzyme